MSDDATDDFGSIGEQSVTGSGNESTDAGTLRRARELEALGFLQLTLAVGEKVGWTGGFATVA